MLFFFFFFFLIPCEKSGGEIWKKKAWDFNLAFGRRN